MTSVWPSYHFPLFSEESSVGSYLRLLTENASVQYLRSKLQKAYSVWNDTRVLVDQHFRASLSALQNKLPVNELSSLNVTNAQKSSATEFSTLLAGFLPKRNFGADGMWGSVLSFSGAGLSSGRNFSYQATSGSVSVPELWVNFTMKIENSKSVVEQSSKFRFAIMESVKDGSFTAALR